MVNFRGFIKVCLVFNTVVMISVCSADNLLATNSGQAINNQHKSVKMATELKTLRHAATMGIGLGMLKVHKKMESNLLNLYNNFIKTIKNSKTSDNLALTKLKELEKTMKRDKYAMNILQNGFDFSMNTRNVRNYRQSLSQMALDEKAKKADISMDLDMDVKNVQNKVENHLKFMRDKISSVRDALKRVESKKQKISFTSPKPATQHPPHMNGIFNHDIVRLPQLLVPIYDIDVESFYRFRRQNDEDSEGNNKIDTKESQEEDFDDNFGPPPSSGGGGGIGGLIASLSGGEGGSDVGALVGAISGVITNLFGPGGLDIPSLLSSGTSLLAGLLGL